jgi:hypothetical protein
VYVYWGRVMTPAQTRYMQKSTATASMTTTIDLPMVDRQEGLRQNFLRRRMRILCLWSWCGVEIACSGPANLSSLTTVRASGLDGSGNLFVSFCDGRAVQGNLQVAAVASLFCFHRYVSPGHLLQAASTRSMQRVRKFANRMYARRVRCYC